jgi:major membrane immunogen (membrane-anchored lipoprotein)
MKKLFSLMLAVVMLLSVMLTFTACSSTYGNIEKNFLNAGFRVVDTTDEEGKNYLSIVAAVEDGEIACTVHVLKNGTLFGNDLMYAIIAEYSGNKQAVEALNDYLDGGLSATLKELDESKIVNGNCLLIPIAANLKIEESINQMIEIFNK